MNNTYRLIWNELANTWVAVAENAKSRGKRSASVLLLTAVASVAMAQTVSPQQLPTGGQIVSGSGSISTHGAAMTVNQNTARMIANWSSFNIGANASVNFVQPSASAVALNRIHSQDPTKIMGRLTANGQVMLVNPAGVVFGRGSQVDVGSLVASSLAISDANFLSGNYRFAANGLNTLGSVVNQGRITTANGGAVAFLAPVVKNEGQITTPKGSTLLGAAQDITVDFAGDGLISYRVNAGAASALAENTGTVTADGGMAVLSAKSVDSITQGVVNNAGLVRAQRLESRDGRIVLEGQSVTQAGYLTSNTINASAGGRFGQTSTGVMNADGNLTAQGGSVRVDAGSDVVLSGRVSANGIFGGHITVVAPEISVLGATVQAMGQGAQVGNGGTIRIGGGYQGKDTDIVNAERTRVLDSTLDVSAVQNGNSGTAIIWSEQQTLFNSTANAKGGIQGGNGGLVEVSSKDQLSFAGRVNASAANGIGGRLLLDPKNIIINNSAGTGSNLASTSFSTSASTDSTIAASDIALTLAGGTSLTLQANNDVTVSSIIISGGSGSLTLQAGRSITVNSGRSIELTNANLTLIANDPGAVVAE
jgi:filamentous hemagglutinin family protein